MQILGLVVCLAVASALDLTEHSSGVHPLFKDATPKAWRNAKFSYIEEKETIVESVRRMLGHWMGFDKGNGFVTVTGFTDDQCLHPIWETGANIGGCMVARDENTGNTFGWLKHRLQEKKGKFIAHSEVWFSGNGATGCHGAADEDIILGERSNGCQGYHTYIDAAGPVHSITYGFSAGYGVPKIMHFVQGLFRGKVVFDNHQTCNDYDWDGLLPIDRYYLQTTAPMVSCYQYTAIDGMVHSYRTDCKMDEGGPGYPVNVMYEDDQCQQEATTNQFHEFDQCYDIHPAPGTNWPEMYGGARQYHSKTLGSGNGEAFQHICFFAGMDDEKDGPPLSFYLTPWNNYNDVKIVHDYEDENKGCCWETKVLNNTATSTEEYCYGDQEYDNCPDGVFRDCTVPGVCDVDPGGVFIYSATWRDECPGACGAAGEEYYQCTDPAATCQCSKSKVDEGHCGGAPGCWLHPGGRDACEAAGDRWIAD